MEIKVQNGTQPPTSAYYLHKTTNSCQLSTAFKMVFKTNNLLAKVLYFKTKKLNPYENFTGFMNSVEANEIPLYIFNNRP